MGKSEFYKIKAEMQFEPTSWNKIILKIISSQHYFIIISCLLYIFDFL